MQATVKLHVPTSLVSILLFSRPFPLLFFLHLVVLVALVHSGTPTREVTLGDDDSDSNVEAATAAAAPKGPRQTAGLFSALFFTWATPLIRLGAEVRNTRPLFLFIYLFINSFFFFFKSSIIFCFSTSPFFYFPFSFKRSNLAFLPLSSPATLGRE
jgi:hypothetical protein